MSTTDGGDLIKDYEMLLKLIQEFIPDPMAQIQIQSGLAIMMLSMGGTWENPKNPEISNLLINTGKGVATAVHKLVGDNPEVLKSFIHLMERIFNCTFFRLDQKPH